jgi:hypothetical protein
MAADVTAVERQRVEISDAVPPARSAAPSWA